MTVLPEYTDEYLNIRATDPDAEEGVRERATQLLRVPADLRQQVEVEVHKRTVRTHWRDSTGGRMAMDEMVGDPAEARKAVVDDMVFRLARRGH